MPIARGPKAHFFTGHLREFRADRLGFFTRCARTYGDAVPLRLLHRRLLLISDPALIEQVLVTQSGRFIKHFGLRMYRPILGNGLVTSEGPRWRRQRKLSAPAFQPLRIAHYAQSMIAATTEMLQEWDSAAGTKIRDVHADVMRLTLLIACQTLFGAGFGADPEEVGSSMQVALEAIAVRFSRPIPIPDWIPTPANLRLRRALRPLNRIVDEIVMRQRQSSGPESNLLSTLIASRDENGEAMSDQQLLDEVRTIFLAGHETTALTLSYSLYLLATHAEAQAKLFEELSLLPRGRPPEYGDLARLPYTRQVVTESMRLYPPADVLGREAIADCTVGGVTIRKGTSVFMSPWVMHRDPRFFDRPEAFEPERWTAEFEKSLPRFAYFPFGGGPRYCIGQSFAMTETTLVLAAICQRFVFAPDPTFQLELWPSITLRPRNGLRLWVTARDSPRKQDNPGLTPGFLAPA